MAAALPAVPEEQLVPELVQAVELVPVQAVELVPVQAVETEHCLPRL